MYIDRCCVYGLGLLKSLKKKNVYHSLITSSVQWCILGNTHYAKLYVHMIYISNSSGKKDVYCNIL